MQFVLSESGLELVFRGRKERFFSINKGCHRGE
jgi:hypothetical protein